MADNGTGTTVTFGTSGFSASITNVTGPNESRPAIDTTHMSSTHRTYIPGDLVDGGEVTLDLLFDPDDAVPIDGAAETITITFPLAAGGSTAADWEFTGFVIDHSPVIPLEDKMTSTVTIKVSGDVAKTAAT